MKRVLSAGCVFAHEVRLDSVSETLSQDSQKLEIRTINGGKPGTLERTKQKSSKIDMAREVPEGKLATSESNPDAEASVDLRGDCSSQLGAIKVKMGGNVNSPIAKISKFKESDGIIRSGSVRPDFPYFNMSPSQLPSLCKGSGRVSKSLGNSTINLIKKNINGSDGMNFKHNKSPVTHVSSTRRALRFDDKGEDCKTPIHHVTTGTSLIEFSGMLDSDRKSHMQVESCRNSSQNASLSKMGKVYIENVSPRVGERADNITRCMDRMENSFSACRPGNVDERVRKCSLDLLSGANSKKQKKYKINTRAFNRDADVLVGPGNTDELESCKDLKHLDRMSNLYKPQLGNLRQTSGTTDFSRSNSMAPKHKPFLEKYKVIPKSSNQVTVVSENLSNGSLSAECYSEKDVSSGQRSDITREAISTDSADNKLIDSSMSIKQLIAAAQAKRRETHSCQLLDGSVTPGSNANLISTMQTLPSGNPFQTDKICYQTSVPIEPHQASRHSLVNQGEHEDYDGRFRRGNPQPANSSTDGTEAAVARDALEGMIETLSRTRESIGRATRHSIDCAKYGIATEVVELLIRKLEGEPNFSRKIDLFFLVDSITQCSHNLKGIAGASYVPVVQAALPRLLCAAAPPGASAHENRRQCLKVLRLWLERRILPEYYLRHYMDEIEFRNDCLKSNISPRRTSCAERPGNDPIREMESLLVDEYGSNTTFLFPEFLSGHVLEDNKIFPSSPCNDTADCSPNEAGFSEILIGSEDHRMQAHRHLLEHLENEIEMEDAHTLSPDERFKGGNSSLSLLHPHPEYYWVLESKCGNQTELLLPAVSPPLPLDPPPTPPPLPLSPPPPSSTPPMSSPLSLPTIPPPPPLPLPSALSVALSLTHSPFPSSPYPHESRRSLLQEYSKMANDNQSLQTIGNNAIEDPFTVILKDETIMHQSPNFVPSGVSNTNFMLTPISFKPFETGQREYFTQDFYSEQSFQQCSETIQQVSFHSSLPAHKIVNHPLSSSQIPSDHLCHGKSTSQHHLQQKYNSGTLSSVPHGQRKYGAEDQYRVHHSDTNQYYSGTWNGASTPSGSPAPYTQDVGYSSLNVEGASSVSMNFHHPTHYSAPSQASLPGHNFPHFPAIDFFRPA